MELRTDHLPAPQRLEFWRDTVLRRMDIEPIANGGRPFRARVRRLSGRDGIEVLDYASDAIWMKRTRRRCGDGIDEISIGLVLGEATGARQQRRELSVRTGELYAIDFGQPVESLLAKHHEAAIMLPRREVREVLGVDPGGLGGMRLVRSPLAQLLSSHLRLIIQRRAWSLTEQAAATGVAADLALATLQAHAGRRVDVQRFAAGIHVAVRGLIARTCQDAALTPEVLAARVGCSRASLYRVFAARGGTIEREIWQARLRRAWHLLTAADTRMLSIGEIAFRAGFLDGSAFSRMFKRTYQMTPREARAAAAHSSAEVVVPRQ